MYTAYRPDDKKKDKTPAVFRIIFSAAGIIIGFLLVRIFFTSYRVTDSSMMPSFKPGDYTILLKIMKTELYAPVLIKSTLEHDRYYFGRIAAKAGDTVQIANKEILVNGKKYMPGVKIESDDIRIFPENFTGRDNSEKITVPAKHVFIIGDYIDRSFDSRYFGPVPEKNIVGKVLLNF